MLVVHGAATFSLGLYGTGGVRTFSSLLSRRTRKRFSEYVSDQGCLAVTDLRLRSHFCSYPRFDVYTRDEEQTGRGHSRMPEL